jgi:hypothetical protein
MTGFDVVRVSNARRVPARRDLWTVLKHHWRRRQRARIEIMLGKLYGFGRLPLDPNLTAVLRKSAQPAQAAAAQTNSLHLSARKSSP